MELLPALAAFSAPSHRSAPLLRLRAELSLRAVPDLRWAAGNAEAEASAVFVDPFSANMTAVHTTSFANVSTMREAAESTEIDLFSPQIAAASEATDATGGPSFPSCRGPQAHRRRSTATAAATSTASLVRPRHRADQSQAVAASSGFAAAAAATATKSAKTATAMSTIAATHAAVTTAQQLQRVPDLGGNANADAAAVFLTPSQRTWPPRLEVAREPWARCVRRRTAWRRAILARRSVLRAGMLCPYPVSSNPSPSDRGCPTRPSSPPRRASPPCSSPRPFCFSPRPPTSHRVSPRVVPLPPTPRYITLLRLVPPHVSPSFLFLRVPVLSSTSRPSHSVPVLVRPRLARRSFSQPPLW
ncbi:hypothetical protein C8R44DRAFT_350672 [Mycena epipterygia]|nr:hypothetical protein C8R44DRAFT_350672 [Mycena epipterygia]